MIESAIFPQRILLGLKANFIAASHENSNAQEVIGPLWGEMSWRFFQVPVARDDFPLGIGAMWEDESGQPGAMVYFAGYEVKEVPADLGGLEILEIPEGRYAYVTHSGAVSGLPATVTAFYSTQFPQSDFQRRAGMDLEIYSEVDESMTPTKVLVAVPVL
jgi:predicted transcriptional regulator YdeE